ncbi:MAG: hypothetical protein M9962_13225 [Oligoflexia bacterium]|nr:hypothetical protein [Oligoflexia bacterium]
MLGVNNLRCLILVACYVVLFFNISEANAAKKIIRYCADPVELYNQTEDCEDNVVFAASAIDCLEDLEKLVENARKKLDSNLIKPSDTQQRKSHDQSKANYEMTKATLDALLKQAQMSRKEVDAYMDYFSWPEDFDSEEAVDGDPEGFLNSDPCYIENKEVLANVLSDFDNHIKSLSAASLASFGKETTSGVNAGSAESLSQEVKANKVKGAGSIQLKGQKGPHKASDISGTKEEKK